MVGPRPCWKACSRDVIRCVVLLVAMLNMQGQAWAGPRSALGRRSFFLATATLPLGQLMDARAEGPIDLYSLVLRKKTKCLPTIVLGYRELKEAGEVTDDFIENRLTKMVKMMREFGDANRVTPEYADDVVAKLKKEANTFKAYAKDKNYKKAMKTLEKYRQDIPFGVGVFEWDDDIGQGQLTPT